MQRIDIAFLAVQGTDDHEFIARLAPLLFQCKLVHFFEQLRQVDDVRQVESRANRLVTLH